MLGDLGAACGRRKLGTPPWREAQPIELPSSLRGQKQEEHRCGRALHATKPTPLERAQSTWASTVARSILPDATGARAEALVASRRCSLMLSQAVHLQKYSYLTTLAMYYMIQVRE